MIVFAEIRIEFVRGEVTKAFGFYNTVPDQITEVNGETVFYSRKDLRDVFDSDEDAAMWMRLVPATWQPSEDA